jgi:hypothetical protein
MRIRLCQTLIATLLFAASSSCCEHQYNHSVRRMWCDYNSFRAPALAFEQEDHLPYRAAQVGYYRWMYDKDPGHQLAALGPVTPPPTVVPQCVPPGDNPFDYQVAFPAAIPTPTDSLWAEGQPEPINVPRTLPGDAASRTKELGGALTVPLAPVLPPPTSDKRAVPEPSSSPSGRGGKASTDMPGPLFPRFDAAPPPPRPIDEDVPPMQGPASQENPNVRLTTGTPASSQAPAPPAANSLWPR